MRLIDAGELMEHVYRDKLDSRELIANMVKNAPTIEKRKTGEWINITNDESLDEEYKCSVCGYELFYSYPTNYCPSCGAKMKKEIKTKIMYGICPYDCMNKTEYGYCKSTGCINPKYQQIIFYSNNRNIFPSPCTYCRNNPQNGGSGICHCILGVENVY